MNKRIWKYKLPKLQEGTFTLSLPKGSQLLTLDRDAEFIPCIWVSTNPDYPLVKYDFTLCWTGRDTPNQPYLGMIVEKGLVWHLFGDIQKY